MGYKNKRSAASNINQGKGFECPLCYKYVSPGYDHCPDCGDMPQISGSSNHDFSVSDSENMGCFFWFWLVLGAPAVFSLTKISGKSGDFFLILPILILFFTSIKGLIRIFIDKSGGVSGFNIFVRGWVFTLSFLSLIDNSLIMALIEEFVPFIHTFLNSMAILVDSFLNATGIMEIF